MNIEKTLEERGNNYGRFSEHARITQEMKETMKSGVSWEKMTPEMKEALEMVVHKIGRIVNGDPFFHDSWHDCIGYLTLVMMTKEK